MVTSLPSSGVNCQQERRILQLQKQLIKLGKFIPAYDLLSQKCLWFVQLTLPVNFSCCWHGWVTFTPSSGRHHKHALDYCSGGEIRSLIIQQTCSGVLIVRFTQGLNFFTLRPHLPASIMSRDLHRSFLHFSVLCVLSFALWLCNSTLLQLLLIAHHQQHCNALVGRDMETSGIISTSCSLTWYMWKCVSLSVSV